VDVRDLYAIGFDPVARADDSSPRSAGEPDAAVRAEMEAVRAADVIVFVSPVWWISMPAILKGWVDRVFRPGFAYGHGPDRKVRGTLAGKRGLVFTSSGSTEAEFLASGKMQAIRTMWGVGTVEFCGIALLEHLHFGPVGSRSTPAMIEGYLAQVEASAARHFTAERW
jgi:NAD(P)H dehydrogenase (quinone)